MGEIRVRVRAAGVNPVDCKIRSGAFAEEFVGEVEGGGSRFEDLRTQGRTHQIEEVGAELRQMMPWISAGKTKVEDASGGD